MYGKEIVTHQEIRKVSEKVEEWISDPIKYVALLVIGEKLRTELDEKQYEISDDDYEKAMLSTLLSPDLSSVLGFLYKKALKETERSYNVEDSFDNESDSNEIPVNDILTLVTMME